MLNQRLRVITPFVVWGVLVLLTVAFAGIFAYGLVTSHDEAQGAVGLPRCVEAEIPFTGRVHTSDGRPVANATIHLHYIGMIENCVHPVIDATTPQVLETLPPTGITTTEAQVVYTLETDERGRFSGAVRAKNNALFRIEVVSEERTAYVSPTFSANYLPYWQFKVIEITAAAAFGS